MHYIVNIYNQCYRLKAIFKKCDFSLDLKMFKVGAALSSCDREFHAAGPAYEKASFSVTRLGITVVNWMREEYITTQLWYATTP